MSAGGAVNTLIYVLIIIVIIVVIVLLLKFLFGAFMTAPLGNEGELIQLLQQQYVKTLLPS